jgi:hypothetical protein
VKYSLHRKLPPWQGSAPARPVGARGVATADEAGDGLTSAAAGL